MRPGYESEGHDGKVMLLSRQPQIPSSSEMSGTNDSQGLPDTGAAVGRSSIFKKGGQIAARADDWGVFLIAEADSDGSSKARSGSVVKSPEGNIFLITSELAELNNDNNRESNVRRSTLFFKRWDSVGKIKQKRVKEVTNLSNGDITFEHGLTIIPVDPKKLARKSGLKNYRNFTVELLTEQELPGVNNLICQIVDGSSRSFEVKTFQLEYGNNQYALRRDETVLKTLSELKNVVCVNSHPSGSVILKKSSAGRSISVGALTFGNDGSICPVFWPQLSRFGRCN